MESARSGHTRTRDGQLLWWIEHETLHGVTPAMLVWWFSHLEGDMEFDGVTAPRYRIWHPRDHISIRYVKRGPEERVGVGSVIHLTEMFGSNPEYLVDVDSEILRLDEAGFAHAPRVIGAKVAQLDYTFEAVEGGTRYRNSLRVGFEGWAGKVINPFVEMFAFNDARGAAWIKHNIEEVGNFEAFLPTLYAREHGRSQTTTPR